MELPLKIEKAIIKAGKKFEFDSLPPHVKHGLTLIGIYEVGGNNIDFSNQEFKKRLLTYGWHKKDAYCGFTVEDCLTVANAINPVYRGGLARGYFTKGYLPFKDPNLVEAGDLIIWQRDDSIFGHVGIVVMNLGKGQFITIEGNTSPGDSGSQFNGDGIYLRIRTFTTAKDSPGFHVLGFSKVSYGA